MTFFFKTHNIDAPDTRTRDQVPVISQGVMRPEDTEE